MYREGTLRPPTEIEMQKRYLPLEYIELRWFKEGDWDVRTFVRKVGEGLAREDAYEPTMAELVAYIVEYQIPVSAKVVYHKCGSHALALDWMEAL